MNEALGRPAILDCRNIRLTFDVARLRCHCRRWVPGDRAGAGARSAHRLVAPEIHVNRVQSLRTV